MTVVLVVAAMVGVAAGIALSPGQSKGAVVSPFTPTPVATMERPDIVAEVEHARVPMAFGIDAAAIDEQVALGIAPDYATLWVGPWSVRTDWNFEDRMLWQMREQGVTPIVQLYYWGDDISQDCLENGCWSDLHDVYKSQESWDRVIEELGWHLQGNMKGERVVVVLETEFNKRDVVRYEPLDRMLADRAAVIRHAYPEAEVVLGLGNWRSQDWGTWDRAAAASDAIGIQAVHAVNEMEDYDGFYDQVLQGARTANETFGLPVFVHDVAFSSYDGLEEAQADGLERFFAGLDALRDAGVQAIVYRSWKDAPSADIDNTFGHAERHWGLVRSDESRKPAADAWVAGVLSERATEDFGASFQVTDTINPWWVEVVVDGSNAVVSVDAVVDGVRHRLDRTAWGTWAASFRVDPGTDVRFVASDILGQDDTSPVVVWPAG